MRFKAAVLQMRSGLVPSANVATVAAAAREAKANGADYLQTPEMTTVVNRNRVDMMAVIGDDKTNPELDAFQAFVNHARNRVRAAAADADHFDARGGTDFILKFVLQIADVGIE